MWKKMDTIMTITHISLLAHLTLLYTMSNIYIYIQVIMVSSELTTIWLKVQKTNLTTIQLH